MLHDRPYMRAGGRSWGLSWSATTWLLVANTAVFVFQNINQVYLHWPIERHLALSSAGLKSGQLWQLLTFQFLHLGIWHFFINGLMLFMFGRAIEGQLGRGRLFEVYFAGGVLGGLLQGGLGLAIPSHFGFPTMGASAGVSALLAVFCLLHRHQTILLFFVLPVRAYYLLIGCLVVAGFFVVVPADRGVAHAAHLGGLLAGIGYVRLLLDRERRLFDWRPYADLARSRDLVPTGRPRRSLLRHQSRPVRREEDLPPAEFISREVDPILDKISAHGIQSLTEREKKILEAARSRMARR